MNDARAMLLYARLAAVSSKRRQVQVCDRFLILSGMAATRCGCRDVADRCHRLVASRNPHHLLARYASMADALRDQDFAPFAIQLQRFCSLERAEHMLTQVGQSTELPDGESECDTALAALASIAG